MRDNGPSINYVNRRGGLAKCLCYYINLCSKLAYGGVRGVKNSQILAYVVYGCPLGTLDCDFRPRKAGYVIQISKHLVLFALQHSLTINLVTVGVSMIENVKTSRSQNLHVGLSDWLNNFFLPSSRWLWLLPTFFLLIDILLPCLL